jgi:hypothetical protein
VSRSRQQRRRDRAEGIDRFGRPLPRSVGTNPRARRVADATRGARTWRVARDLLDDFVTRERIGCFVCKRPAGPWAAGGWREASESDANPTWAICVRCVRKRKELRAAA